MRKLSFAVLLAVCAIIAASAPARFAEEDFGKTWIKIDSLESAGLYRSALKLSEQVYQESRQKADQENEIKSLIYRLKYTQELEEDGNFMAISLLQKELPDERPVPRALKLSLMGELLHRHYLANRWEIAQKTDETDADITPSKVDPAKAGPTTFYRSALESYRQSLTGEEILSKIPVSSIKGLLTGTLADTVNQSTLYDLLVKRALGFIEMADDYPVMALRPSILCSKELFSEQKAFAKTFTDPTLSIQDPWSQALQWYAQWLNHSPGNLAANLRRLEYVKSVSCHTGAEEMYAAALYGLIPAYEGRPQSAEIFQSLANFHLERASRYQINSRDTQEFISDRIKAREWLEKALPWNETRAGLNCKNLLTSLLSPEFTVQTESVQVPGTWFPVSIEYRNLNKLFYRIYRVNPLDYQAEWQELESGEKISRLNGQKILKKGEWAPFKESDLNPHRINQLVEPLPPGFYLLALSSSKEWSEGQGIMIATPFTVSRITLVSRVKETGSREFYFRDRYSGEALNGIKVIPYYGEYDPANRRSVFSAGSVAVTGEEGQLVLDESGREKGAGSARAYRIMAIAGTDTLLTQESFYPGFGITEDRRTTVVQIYTDRSIYKPGSRVWFRGVMIDRYRDSLAVHYADSIQITVQDPRYQTIAQFRLPVDTYGVFVGSADLPTKGLTGNYTIQTPFGSASMSMEQYSRPTYSIVLDPVRKAYLNGDTLVVNGKVAALSGEPVSEADMLVEVDLARAISPRGFWPMMDRRTRVLTTRIRTNTKGEFSWHWRSIPEESNPFGSGAILDYEVIFQVTDLSGETHQEKTRLICGKGSKGLRVDCPARTELGDTLKINVNSGIGGEFPIEVRLSRLNESTGNLIESALPEPDRFVITPKDWRKRVPLLPYRKDNLPENLTVKELVAKIDGVSDKNEGVRFFTGVDWPEGWYKLEISTGNQAVRTPAPSFIYLQKPNADKVPGDQELFATVSSPSVKAGGKLTLRQGSLRKGFILTQLQLPDGTMVDWWAESGKRISEISWNVERSWQGGASVEMLMFRNNRIYRHRFLIDVPREKVNLSITGPEELSKVKPGDSVQLRLHVTDDGGLPVKASLAVTIYDASLDKIKQLAWPHPVWPRFTGFPGFDPLFQGIAGSFQLVYQEGTREDVPYFQPIDINWWGMGYYGIGRLEAAMPMKAAAADKGMARNQGRADSQNQEDQAMQSLDAAGLPEETGQTGSSGIPVEIRKDFRETALFEGRILTDKNGLGELKFKVPEVFTEWKLLVAGHDLGMAVGSAEHSFRSSKELMLKPNFPAFLRQGDTLVLSSRIGWYGKKRIHPETRLTLDYADGQGTNPFEPKKMTLEPSTTTLLEWDYKVSRPGNLVYKLVTEEDEVSDGMQDTLQVYPDKALLWRSQAFFMGKPGKRKMEIPVSPVKAQVELTTTPAWQVLLSLPAVIQNERDCSEYWFSRLYLSGITGTIGDKYPEARKFYLDHSEEGILDSLNHPLVRNQSIRGKSWESTPWPQIVKNEKARIAQMRKWMNPEERNREMAYSLEKIASLQNPDGSWPWFRGMGSDWYTTMQIVAGFGELKGWQVLDIAATQRGSFMIARALEGLDGWMSRQFRDLMKLDSTGKIKVQLNPMLIQYLYTRSFYTGWTISPKDELAWIYFMERIPQEWTSHDPGLQAMMAIALVQSGKMAQSVPIYKSLRERMTESEEMGAWWPRKGFGSEWYQWDIWMQSKMIELFAAMEDGRKELDKLRLYLVQQKRGRDWGNGLVAAWASKSLLFFGSDLENKPAQVSFKWGGDQFSSLRIKTGSSGPQGYYRINWDTPESMPKAKNLEFNHSGGSPAWGALYTLEEHKIDELKSEGGSVTIQRNLLTSNSANQWEIVKPDLKLKAGTRVKIRLVIKSDRQLSYVEIKDFLGTGFKPVSVLSGYKYQAGLGWYQAREPEAVVFYIPILPKGERVIEYEVLAEQVGSYFAGYAEAQSMYAPEFRAWSNSARISVKR